MYSCLVCCNSLFGHLYLWLFDEASTSSTLAKQTHESDSTLAYRRFISDSTIGEKRFENETIVLSAQIRNAEKSYHLNKMALDSAIAANKELIKQQELALQETRNDFKIENQPFLEMKIPVRIDTIGIDVPIFLSYQIKNLGKYPVKIIEDNSATIARYNVPIFDSVFNGQNKRVGAPNYVNRYITYDAPLEEQVYTPFSIDEPYYNGIKFKKMPIYDFGYIKYVNLATGQEREYDYMIKITFLSEKFMTTDFIKNENFDLPKK